MESFRTFMEIEGAFGYNQYYGNPFGRSGRQIHSNQPFLPTHALTRRYDALMSPRRRQLLDVEEPGQKYQYYIILVRNMIADVDTGKLIAGHEEDPYKVVYTKNEMTKQGYGPEEQKKISDELQIFKWRSGYDHAELIKVIGSNDLDKVQLFRHGQLFDPDTNPNFVEREGFFVDYDRLSVVHDKLTKWITIQDFIERGIKLANLGIGTAIRQGAAMNRIPDSPSTRVR